MAYPPPSWRFSPLPRKINHSTFPRISSAPLKWLCEASWPYERFNLAALSGKLKAYLLGRIHAPPPLSRRGNYHQHHWRRCCRILELFERWFRAIVPSSEENLDVACPSTVFHENAWSRAVNLEINTRDGEMVVGEDELRAVCCRLTPSLQEAARVVRVCRGWASFRGWFTSLGTLEFVRS